MHSLNVSPSTSLFRCYLSSIYIDSISVKTLVDYHCPLHLFGLLSNFHLRVQSAKPSGPFYWMRTRTNILVRLLRTWEEVEASAGRMIPGWRHCLLHFTTVDTFKEIIYDPLHAVFYLV
jgi:hypothetical protein